MESPHLPDGHPPLPDDRNEHDDRCLSEELLDLMTSGELTERDAAAWVLHVGLGWPQWRIARGLELSQPTVYRCIRTCSRVLREKRE